MFSKKAYAVYIVFHSDKPRKPYAVYQTRKEAIKTKKEAESLGFNVKIEKVKKV